MQEVGVNIYSLPEVDCFRDLVVCIDYFSKWSELKLIKDKSTSTITQFLYEVICQHGWIKVQINNQGREFVNDISKVLHSIVIILIYHSRNFDILSAS